jgi:DNA replication protein DnaC
MLKGVNDYAKLPKKCLFINVNTLMDRIFSSFSDPTEMWTKEHSIELIGDADLVVLDDLGTESSMTDKGQASEFVQKLLYRISNRPTELIITTNLSQQQFKRTYNLKIISRLFANTRNSIIDFSGIADKRY